MESVGNTELQTGLVENTDDFILFKKDLNTEKCNINKETSTDTKFRTNLYQKNNKWNDSQNAKIKTKVDFTRNNLRRSCRKLYLHSNCTLDKTSVSVSANSLSCCVDSQFIQGFDLVQMRRSLEKDREMELAKMIDLSTTLKILRSNSKCSEKEIQAEKELLRSRERHGLLFDKLSHLEEEVPEKETNLATVLLKDIKFSVRKEDKPCETLFICTAKYDTDVRMSESALEGNNELSFPDVFSIESVREKFVIELNVFSISYKKRTLVQRGKGIVSRVCSTKSIIDSKFKLCGSLKITENHLKDPNAIWQFDTEPDSPLTGRMSMSTRINNLCATHNLSGYLNMGKKTHSMILWNMQYCVLKGSLLKVYNSPMDEAFNRPLCTISLLDAKNCQDAKQSECPRKKAFKITIIGDDTYYFIGNEGKTGERWKNALNSTIKYFRSWSALDDARCVKINL